MESQLIVADLVDTVKNLNDIECIQVLQQILKSKTPQAWMCAQMEALAQFIFEHYNNEDKTLQWHYDTEASDYQEVVLKSDTGDLISIEFDSNFVSDDDEPVILSLETLMNAKVLIDVTTDYGNFEFANTKTHTLRTALPLLYKTLRLSPDEFEALCAKLQAQR